MALSSVPVQLLIWPHCQHTRPLRPISAAVENNLAGSCPLNTAENNDSVCRAAAVPLHFFFFSSTSSQQCWAQSTTRHFSTGTPIACYCGQGARHTESLGDGSAAGTALPSCQFKFCLCCQEDKLVAGTQGHFVIAHAPLLAVMHLENIFCLQIPKRQEKSRSRKQINSKCQCYPLQR